MRDGSIIVTIMTAHMPTNDAAIPAHVCPHIGVHTVDIVQPPVIGNSPIADIDALPAIVAAALPAKHSTDTPRKTAPDLPRRERCAVPAV
jgi:hypothetical protein